MKPFFLVALCSPFLVALSHASSVTLYGFIDEALVYSHQNKSLKDGISSATNKAELKSNVWRGSRWGIKGSEDLGKGFSIGFTLENGFTPDNGKTTLGGRLFGRQSTINVDSPFGNLFLGRIGAINSGAGPLSMSGWFSPFGTSCGDYSAAANNYMWGHQRFDNMISYISPQVQGFELRLQYSFDGDNQEDINPNVEGVQHGVEGRSSTSHYYAAGLKYKTSNVDLNLIYDRLQYSRMAGGTRAKTAYSITAGGSLNIDRIKLKFSETEQQNS